MIQWTLDSGGVKTNSIEEHVQIQLALLFVSLLGTTILLTFVIYELAAHPECVGPLRAEIETVMQGGYSAPRKGSLPKTRKLDSFIKETQRLNATTAVLLNQMMRRTCTLSDGTVLPARTDIAVNSTEVNFDELLLRNEPGAESKYQLVKAGLDSLGFGLGGQVCPGRFFAGAEIKVIVSFVILNYDVRFQGGETGDGSTTSIVDDVFVKPREIEFKKRV